MAVTYWIFNYGLGGEYTFPRNPDRYGGDSMWVYEQRNNELDILGASLPTIQIDGFRGARRSLKFTAITGTMMRALQTFYLDKAEILNCRDHLYGTTADQFNCFILEFSPSVHPTMGSFPGSGEDTYDLQMVLVRTS